jgi:hypothetical protein
VLSHGRFGRCARRSTPNWTCAAGQLHQLSANGNSGPRKHGCPRIVDACSSLMRQPDLMQYAYAPSVCASSWCMSFCSAPACAAPSSMGSVAVEVSRKTSRSNCRRSHAVK